MGLREDDDVPRTLRLPRTWNGIRKRLSSVLRKKKNAKTKIRDDEHRAGVIISRFLLGSALAWCFWVAQWMEEKPNKPFTVDLLPFDLLVPVKVDDFQVKDLFRRGGSVIGLRCTKKWPREYRWKCRTKTMSKR